MKTIRLYIRKSAWRYDEIKKEQVLFVLLLVVLVLMPAWLHDPEETASYLLKQLLPLVLIAFVVYMLLLGLAFWLLQRFWEAMGFPELEWMVLRFKEMQVWWQLGFYCVAFALLLVTGVGVLIAVL